MRVDAFDFDLPDTSIAVRPAVPRDSSRLLCVKSHKYENYCVRDLPDLLQPGDVMVFNDVRVLRARLKGVRLRGIHQSFVEAMLHQRISENSWLAFIRPGKRIVQGDILYFSHAPSSCEASVKAYVLEKYDSGECLLGFDLSGAFLDEALHAIGMIPLPPYICSKRPSDERDFLDYQTVYAGDGEAVAAPTAGLHFTRDLFDQLDKRGIECLFVTLNVGAGTFASVRVSETSDHIMHAEKGTVSASVASILNRARREGRRIIAVGTTSLRLLETSATSDGTIQAWSGETNIFITPGYRFKTADILMTNFHLPRSTLFMLVSAFCGLDTMHDAYRYAIESGYRFYSYGDCCLLFRELSC